MAVPTRILVKGKRNTTSRMNGILLKTSIKRFKTKLSGLLGINHPGLVSLVREPKIIAAHHEMIKEANDMYKVSNVAASIPSS